MSTSEAREYLTGGLEPVECHGCATRVLVRKASAAQTSVQWTGAAAASCPELAARVAAGEPRARVQGCPKLRVSIDLAVADGLIEVPDG